MSLCSYNIPLSEIIRLSKFYLLLNSRVVFVFYSLGIRLKLLPKVKMYIIENTENKLN
jgi:hypothetical protein